MSAHRTIARAAVHCTAILSLLASAAPAWSQAQENAPLFAAPKTAPAAAGAPAISMLQVTLSLAAVLALVFAAAWALRQMRKVDWSGNAKHLQIVAQVALGSKERAVLIKAHGVQVLVGVAPGQVTALHTFGREEIPEEPAVPPPEESAPPAKSDFKSLLKKTVAQNFGWPR
jgi:flagellar protein FliO/FliZ